MNKHSHLNVTHSDCGLARQLPVTWVPVIFFHGDETETGTCSRDCKDQTTGFDATFFSTQFALSFNMFQPVLFCGLRTNLPPSRALFEVQMCKLFSQGSSRWSTSNVGCETGKNWSQDITSAPSRHASGCDPSWSCYSHPTVLYSEKVSAGSLAAAQRIVCCSKNRLPDPSSSNSPSTKKKHFPATSGGWLNSSFDE